MDDRIDVETPIISVIVPIYNVNPYLCKCLDSLKNQTLKQIEVICIDDGSTDESGKIADEYCNTDDSGNGDEWPLFRIIHAQLLRAALRACGRTRECDGDQYTTACNILDK